jgi:glutathione peroxidase
MQKKERSKMMSIYDFKVKSIDGDDVSFKDYEGKVLIIVNTASKCGFTPQYEDLQKLYEKYNDKGLEILGFPSNQFKEQEPGDSKEIKNFCQINYGVTFPLFEKIDVRGETAHPLFQYLTQRAPFKALDENHPIGKILIKMLSESSQDYFGDDSIKWNFTKFLIDRSGNVVGRFEPTTSPSKMEADIEKLL